MIWITNGALLKPVFFNTQVRGESELEHQVYHGV
jgi:hypothetical protein